MSHHYIHSSSKEKEGEKFSINRRLLLSARPRHLIERLEEILITEMQAKILAALLNEIRPRWAVGSMLKILEKHHQHPAKFVDIALAAVTAARDPSVETPGLFFNDTRFWPEDIKAKLPKPPPCADHPTFDSTTCASCWGDVRVGDRPAGMIGKHWDPPLPQEE